MILTLIWLLNFFVGLDLIYFAGTTTVSSSHPFLLPHLFSLFNPEQVIEYLSSVQSLHGHVTDAVRATIRKEKWNGDVLLICSQEVLWRDLKFSGRGALLCARHLEDLLLLSKLLKRTAEKCSLIKADPSIIVLPGEPQKWKQAKILEWVRFVCIAEGILSVVAKLSSVDLSAQRWYEWRRFSALCVRLGISYASIAKLHVHHQRLLPDAEEDEEDCRFYASLWNELDLTVETEEVEEYFSPRLPSKRSRASPIPYAPASKERNM